MVDYQRRLWALNSPASVSAGFNKHILAKVPKVLGVSSAKFLADDTYVVGNGALVTRQIYNFPKREAYLMDIVMTSIS